MPRTRADDETQDVPVIDMAEHQAADEGEPEAAPVRARRPGRPRATRTKTEERSSSEILRRGVKGIHKLGAAFVDPTLEIDDHEAAAIADPLNVLLGEYGHDPSAHPKEYAWLGLVTALAEVDGPRIQEIYFKRHNPAPEPIPADAPEPTINLYTPPPSPNGAAPRAPSPEFLAAQGVLGPTGDVVLP